MLEKRLTKLERQVHQRLIDEQEHTLRALTNKELLDLLRILGDSGEGRDNDSEEVLTPAQLAAVEAAHRLYNFEAGNGSKFVR